MAHKDAIGNYFKVAFVVASIPIRFIVAAVKTIIAIVKAVVAAVRATVAGFRAAWNAVKAATSSVWNAIGAAIRAAWAKIKSAVTTGVNAVKTFLSGAWNTIKAVASRVWNAVKSVISNVWNGIKSVIRNAVSLVKGIINGWSNIGSTIGGFFQRAYDAVKDKIGSIVDFVRGLPGKILSALGNMGSILYDAGKNVISGLLNGIKDAVQGVLDFAGGIADKIRAVKGPEAKDKKLLRPAGRLIIAGLQQGLEDEYGSVHASLAGLTRSMTVHGPTTTTAGADGVLVGRGVNVTYTGDVTVTDYEEFKREDNTRLRDFMTMANLAGAV
jgi:phage-related protein